MYGKKIRPWGIGVIMGYICSLILWALIIFFIVSDIIYYFDILLIFLYFLGIFAVVIPLWLIYTNNAFYVILTEEKIIVTKQIRLFNKNRVQYGFEILKKDEIFIVYTYSDFTNSLGEKFTSCVKGYKYLIFNMKDGTKNKLWAEVFSENQLKEITRFYLDKK